MSINTPLKSPHQADIIKIATSKSLEPPVRAKHDSQPQGDCAGRHFIVDIWECIELDNCAFIENALIEAAQRSGAVLLHIHLHKFCDGEGVTGVALLAESHISVHTWPERNYAAFDVFMCGDSKPELAVDYLCSCFKARRTQINEIQRGKTK